jgi:CheY-like chemotaxis protein
VHRDFQPAILQEMIGQGRLDDALSWLYEMRDRHPDANAVSDQIRIVRDLISEIAIERLGRTDVAPARLRRDLPVGNNDAAYLLDRIDGVCTVDDLITISRLPRHKTLRTLVSLMDDGFVGFDRITGTSPGTRASDPGARTSDPGTSPGSTRALEVSSAGSVRAVELRLVSSDESSRPPSEPVSSSDTKPRPARRPRVLIAESDATRATMLRVLLGTTYEFLNAQNGPETVEMAVRHVPDAIVLAFQLAGMDGVETARRIRGLPSLRSVGIVLTATGLEANLVKPVLPELNARLVEKPIQKDELRNTVSALLPAGDD